MCLNCHRFYRYPKGRESLYKYKITETNVENIDIFLDYAYCKKALHNFKYGGNLFLGKQLGKLWAEHLKEVEWIESVDFIMPITLHRKKLYKRGYNQSEVLGRVLSKNYKFLF